MASNFSDIEIYEGKTFDELLKQIHENSNEKSLQIKILIDKLMSFIKNPDDANLLVPLIVEYLEVGVKNDEQLIKLAAIIQRFTKTASSSSDDNSGGLVLSDAERKQIIENSKESAKILKMGS